jgi:penicillin-binding protein 2
VCCGSIEIVSPKFTSGMLAQTFDRRSFVVGAVQGGIGLLLAARMGYIAVAENEKYEMEAESNRVNLVLIPPRRGWILDRHGSPLASNRADFRVDIIPERLVDADQEISTVGELLKLTPVEVQDLRDKIAKSARFQPVQVADGLDYDTFAAVTVRLPELPGVVPQRGFSRFYPTGPAVGHLIGYVGAASREEYEADPSPLLLTPGLQARQGRAREAVRAGLAGGARRAAQRGHRVGPHRPRPRLARGRAGSADQADHRRPVAGLRLAAHRP